jgi:uncharacterized membrane protein YeaQ/YmgE (transglycosylase-associated protein family)
MSEQPIDPTPAEAEDNEPVFYNPKSVALISNIMEWVAWIVLAGFIGQLVANVVTLNTQAQGASLSDLFAQVGAATMIPYLVTSFLIPALTGLTFFFALLGVANGLNVLREIEFNQRESK